MVRAFTSLRSAMAECGPPFWATHPDAGGFAHLSWLLDRSGRPYDVVVGLSDANLSGDPLVECLKAFIARQTLPPWMSKPGSRMTMSFPLKKDAGTRMQGSML